MKWTKWENLIKHKIEWTLFLGITVIISEQLNWEDDQFNSIHE